MGLYDYDPAVVGLRARRKLSASQLTILSALAGIAANIVTIVSAVVT
jgi:hypothetical protein